MITLHRLTITNFKALRSIDIVFPQHASVLIEGLNESGKSSLFEAVIFALYGEPLITEDTTTRGKGRAESVITHQANETRVRLEMQVGDTRLEITRTLKHRGNTQAKLTITTSGRPESVTGQTAVNTRILQELGNLNKDALLNSCFVEQKQLGKLEEMGTNDRRESLEQLLNLARLQRIQKQQQVTRDEDREVEVARKRLAYAQKQADLRTRDEGLIGARQRLARLRLVEAFTLADKAQAQIGTLQEERDDLARQRDELAATHTRLTALTDVGKDLANLNRVAGQLAQQRQEAQRVVAQLAECDRAERETLPAAQARLQTLQTINDLFQSEAGLQKTAEQLDQIRRDHAAWERRRHDFAEMQRDLAQAQNDLATQQKTLPALVAAREQAQSRLSATVERGTLERWLAAADDTGRTAGKQEERLAAEKAAEQNEARMRQHDQQRQQAQQRFMFAAIGAAASALIAGVLIILGMVWGAALFLATVGLGLLAWQATKAQGVLRSQRVTLEAAQRQTTARVMQLQAEERAWQEFGGGKIQEDAARSLREHGLAVPTDVATAQTRLAALPQDTASQAELQSALNEAERALNAAQAQRETDERQIAEWQRRIQATSDPAPEGEELSQRLAQLAGWQSHAEMEMPLAIDAFQAQIDGKLTTLRQTLLQYCQAVQIEPAHSTIQQAIGGMGNEIAQVRATIARRPEWQQQAATVQSGIQTLEAEGRTLWQRVRHAAPDLLLAETPSFESADLQQIEQRHAALVVRLDADGTREQMRKLDQRLGEINTASEASQRQMAEHQARITRILSDLALPDAPDETAVRSALPALPASTTPQEISEIETRINDLDRQSFSLRQDLMTLANELGITPEETLDVTACAADVATREHEVRVKRAAAAMIDGVRNRMIMKVLPKTEENMRLLLPQLTMGRYRDCEITEDYKLQIWDDAAQRPVAKNIFSGGARDQFSLALRLAFALATLPEALGTTPGFIFLDEPLSSFDAPRSEALVTLLTKGQIHDNFSQIFVISHNLLFDRRAFTHHLRLEYGAVVESTLPHEQNTVK